MLITYHTMKGSNLKGTDDSVGSLNDVFFDGESWVVRYLVCDTGKWLPGRKVLLSPVALGERDWSIGSADVGLTREQVEASPDIDTAQPIERRMEIELAKHFDWPCYWGAGAVGGAATLPPATFASVDEKRKLEREVGITLRSVNEVCGYYIKATDGDIGHVEDFVIDDHDWVIRYVVVDTKNWLPGRKVLVAPAWIESIQWADASVKVSLSRTEIKESPAFDPSIPVNRKYEEHLHGHYGRDSYWL